MAPYADDNLLPLSALQHLVFCERQCALIHLEQAWEESALTLEGRALHERVDEDSGETRPGVRIARGLSLRNVRLGLAGRADVVEFQLVEGPGGGVELAKQRGRWVPFPVEYKRGTPKSHDADKVQLCAQALCLEEMLGTTVPAGALFYGRTRRRLDVVFDAALRRGTEEAAARLRSLFISGTTPPAVRAPKCDRCSLFEICKPDMPRRSARAYLEAELRTP